MNGKKVDPHYLTVSFRIQFLLTTQNIVVAFHIDREVPNGRGSEVRKIVYTYLLFKEI
jgi:hypothetical protein